MNIPELENYEKWTLDELITATLFCQKKNGVVVDLSICENMKKLAATALFSMTLRYTPFLEKGEISVGQFKLLTQDKMIACAVGFMITREFAILDLFLMDCIKRVQKEGQSEILTVTE